MKIHNHTSIRGKASPKTTLSSSSSGLFGQMLEATPTAPDQVKLDSRSRENPSHHPTPQAPMQEAWQTLETSVSLLDQAMHHIESGESPPHQLIADIEQLRSLLRDQVSSGNPALELRQADTLLAVEAERIRAMQS